MLKIENTQVVGWEAAIRGLRNPLESWAKSDSYVCTQEMCDQECGCGQVENHTEPALECDNGKRGFCVGANDWALMRRLAGAGTADHRKYLRMIAVYADITAPMYWWKEADTYKVGTVRNSCSTMHGIHKKPFTVGDFSREHMGRTSAGYDPEYYDALAATIEVLNKAREKFLKTGEKAYWWQMIQLLPSSYNQRATVMLNYEVLRNMYASRKNHKLDEWRTFCEWVENCLPYAELITGGAENG